MPSFRTIAQMALVTVAVMYSMNLIAAKVPATRKIVKGGLVASI